MANSFIPRGQDLALSWMNTFARTISFQPSVYQLSPADAATIQQAVNTFDDAYHVALNPATATRGTIRAKDEARNSAEQICRLYASLIKPNRGVSTENKIAIGVRPLNRGRTKIACPSTSPCINVIAATPGRQILRYHDSFSPNSIGKPFGAVALQVFIARGDVRETNVENARFYGSFTRNPVTIEFDSEDDGRMATYFARWTSRRGETGPWSLPSSMRIAA